MFSQAFFEEIIALAKQISWNLREQRAALWADPTIPEILPVESVGEVTGLRVKFKAELEELRAAGDPWDELPDIAYYAACIQARKSENLLLAGFVLRAVAHQCT